MKKIKDMTRKESMALYMKAYKLAHKAHEGQFRKDGITPYFKHPVAVRNILGKQLYLGEGEFYEIVAILHDVIEDSDYTYEDLEDIFGSEIADAVNVLTKKKGEKKVDYLKRVMTHENAKIVRIKIADRLSNIKDAIELDNSKENKSFKKYYLKRTKEYFIPHLDETVRLHRDLMLAWYQLRDSYYEEKYKI